MVSEETRENARPRNEDEEKLVKSFHEALHGGMCRDTLDNTGVAFTGKVLREVEKRCDALMEDPDFRSSLLKL